MTLSTASEPVPFELDEHGVARIGGTRVTLETLIGMYKRGDTAESLSKAFPAVSLADIHGVISYYLRHTDEVEEYLTLAHAEGDAIEAKYRDLEREKSFAAELKRRWSERNDRAAG